MDALPLKSGEVRRLEAFSESDFARIVTGYRSTERYRVHRTESEESVTFTLRLERLAVPFVKRYPPPDADTIAHYCRLPLLGFSFGAFARDECVGLILAEPHTWNRSLWVWELHVAEPFRGRGIGRCLIEAVIQPAAAAGLRTMVCETQNTNVPAVRFYRRLGFRLEGMDLSHYAESVGPDSEIALFMKRPPVSRE